MSTTPTFMADIGRFVAGSGFPNELQGNQTGDYPFAKVGDISIAARSGSQFISQANNYLDAAGVKKIGAKILPKGSILFAKIGEAISQNFRVIAACDMLIDNNAMGFVPDPEKVDGKYIFHFLKSIDFYALASKTTVPAIRKSDLDRIQINLPALEEQKRIAAILDKADNLRRKRAQAIALADDFELSVINQLLSLENGVKNISIADLIRDEIILLHKDGNHGSNYPRASDFVDRPEDGVPFLSAQCMNADGSLGINKVTYLGHAKARQLTIGWVKPGDILLAHNATVGPVMHYRGPWESALIGTSLTCFRPNYKKTSSEAIFASLQDPFFQLQLKKQMKQTTRNQVPITAQRDLKVRLPDSSLVKALSARLAAIHNMKSKMQLLEVENTLLNVSMADVLI